MHILLIEDNPGDALLIKEYLNLSNVKFSFTQTSRLKNALLLLEKETFDVILLDLGLPDSMGLDTLRQLQLKNVKPAIIIMTGLDDEDIALKALKEGAQDYLVKSKLSSEKILHSIKFSVERKKLLNFQQKQTRQFSTLSDATTSFNECEDVKAIYIAICKSIIRLQNNIYIVAFDFIKNTIVRIVYSRNLEPFLENIKSYTGLNLYESAFYKTDVSEKVLELFKDCRLHEIKGCLFELSNGKFDKDICDSIENLLEVRNTYVIGFSRNDVYYGGLALFSKNSIDENDKNIIEAISNQASLNIHRRTVEKTIQKLNAGLENKVLERTKKLNELIATKDKFFGIIAHDLKNPFSGLLGASELLFNHAEDYDTENIKSLSQLLHNSAKNVYIMLENLLEWARAQTGNIKFNPEEIIVKEFVSENVSNVKAFAENKDIKLHSQDLDGYQITGDRNMLNTVLRNLLNNAIKFTKNGGKVSVSVIKNEDNILFSVKDSGIGIPEKEIDKLFRIDIKYCRNGTNTEPGTGLGLILCKEFIERHNGKIWVESIENVGSEFKFSIPL